MLFPFGSPALLFDEARRMSQSKHTATPWQVHEIETRDDSHPYMSYAVADAQDRVIVDATNSSVADIRYEPDAHVVRSDVQSEADAAFIVKAANCFDDATALARLVVEYFGDEPISGVLDCDIALRDAAKAFLAKAMAA